MIYGAGQKDEGCMEQRKENKMGVMPVPKLLVSMSVPIMASMLIQALYNVVDSVFVVRYSEDALAAVSLAFPVQAMMIAISVGTAVGINAVLSRKLGEKSFEEANLVAKNGLFLALLSSIAFMLFGIFGVRSFFAAFVQGGEVMRMGIEYTSIVSIASMGIFFSVTGERLLQATGITVYSMYGQMAGAITNIVLDPIFIFGLLGAPRLGAAGAAIATVIGQVVSMVLMLYFNITKNHEINLSLKGFVPDRKIILEIYRIGLPSIFMQAIGSVMTFGLNKILILFSQAAVSVFGIYFKLQSFIFMPVFGLTNGMIPIVGYNYGARNHKRIVETLRLSVVMAVAIMGLGTLAFWVLPGFILRTLFEASEAMLSIGVPALRLISLSFLPAAVNIVLSSSFQALGRGMYSLLASAVRQLVVLLPLAYLLGTFVSLNALWLAFPAAELVATAIVVTLFIKVYRNQIRSI